MIKNNIYLFLDIHKLPEILSTLVINGYLNLDIMPRREHSPEWLMKYWGVTDAKIPVEINHNKLSFVTQQEVNIATLLQIAKMLGDGNIEYLAASDKLGEFVKHITISQRVPVHNNITINTKEFACLVWEKDYYDYLKKAGKNKQVTLDDIAPLEDSEEGYSMTDNILAIGGLNAGY